MNAEWIRNKFVLNDWQIRSNSEEGGPDIGNIKAASRVTRIQLCIRCSLVHIHPLRYQDRQNSSSVNSRPKPVKVTVPKTFLFRTRLLSEPTSPH
jgi:hypothetical protein